MKQPTPRALKLADRITQAVREDEGSHGCDIGAGIYGTNFSQLIIELAGPEVDYKGHSSLADMIIHHILHWRNALQLSKAICETQDNRDFYDHELKALDEIESAVKSLLGE